MRNDSFVIYILCFFLLKMEEWFVLSRYEVKRKRAQMRWYKRVRRISRVQFAGEEYWKKYPIPYQGTESKGHSEMNCGKD